MSAPKLVLPPSSPHPPFSLVMAYIRETLSELVLRDHHFPKLPVELAVPVEPAVLEAPETPWVQ